SKASSIGSAKEPSLPPAHPSCHMISLALHSRLGRPHHHHHHLHPPITARVWVLPERAQALEEQVMVTRVMVEQEDREEVAVMEDLVAMVPQVLAMVGTTT